MKSLLLILVLILVTACGKSGGGGSTGSQIEPIRVDCQTEVKRDSLFDYAVSANNAQRDCNLTEEQAVQFVTTN